MNIRRRPNLDLIMRVATMIGDGPLWGVISVVAALIGPEGRNILPQIAAAFALNLVACKVVKRYFGRPRPFERILVVEPGARVPDQFSFPSGHTAASCVMATVLGHAFPVMILPLLLLVLLIGTSRVYLDMHYPSDVLAGAALGSGSGFCALTWIG